MVFSMTLGIMDYTVRGWITEGFSEDVPTSSAQRSTWPSCQRLTPRTGGILSAVHGIINCNASTANDAPSKARKALTAHTSRWLKDPSSGSPGRLLGSLLRS